MIPEGLMLKSELIHLLP